MKWADLCRAGRTGGRRRTTVAGSCVAPLRRPRIEPLEPRCLLNGDPAVFDFGDAPAPYPTLLSETGAQHEVIVGGDAIQRLGGGAGATPLAGDWDGNGVDEIGLHRNRRFYLDFNGNGRWDRSTGGDVDYVFGEIQATPLAGRWEPAGALPRGLSDEAVNQRDRPSDDDLEMRHDLTPAIVDSLFTLRETE